MATLTQKLSISAFSALIFVLVNLPLTFKFTDKVFDTFKDGCPTALGLILHTLVFMVLSYVTMTGASVSKGTKLKHSFYGALIFFLLSNPVTYKVVAQLFGKSSTGCPTLNDIFMHAVIYTGVLTAVMYFP